MDNQVIIIDKDTNEEMDLIFKEKFKNECGLTIIKGENSEIEEMFLGKVGERIIDCKNLIIFTDIISGHIKKSRLLSQGIRLVNPDVKIYLRSYTRPEELNPDFNGLICKYTDKQDHYESTIKIIKLLIIEKRVAAQI